MFIFVLGQSIVTFDLFVDSLSVFNDSGACSSSYPCSTLDYAVKLSNQEIGSHVNYFSINLQHNAPGSTTYHWNSNWTTFSGDSDITSTYTITSTDTTDPDKVIIDINDHLLGSINSAIRTDSDYNSDITVSNVKFQMLNHSHIGSNYFWFSSNNKGYSRLILNNIILQNLSRSVEFVQISNSDFDDGTSSVVLNNSIITDSTFNGDFVGASYGGSFDMYDTVWYNVVCNNNLEYNLNGKMKSEWKNVLFDSTVLNTVAFYKYYPSEGDGINMDINGLTFKNHFQQNYFIRMFNLNNVISDDDEAVGGSSIVNVFVKNSHFSSSFCEYYYANTKTFSIDNFTAVDSYFGYQIFYIYSYAQSVLNTSALGDYDDSYYSDTFIANDLNIIDTKLDSKFIYPRNFYSVEISNANVYNSHGFNHSKRFGEIFSDSDDLAVGYHYIHDIKVWDILVDYCLICNYGAKYANISNIWADNVHSYIEGWVFLDLEYANSYNGMEVYTSNIYINGHLTDSNITNEFDYANYFYLEAVVYFSWNIPWDSDYPSSDPGLYNGFESQQELCDNYIAYHYDWALIDNGVWGPVMIFVVGSQHFGCNITLDSIYIANNTCMYGNWWYTWVSYSDGFEPPAGIVYHYNHDNGENENTIYFNDCEFHYNKNFTIAQCDVGLYCRIEFRNCIFNYNFIEMEYVDQEMNQTVWARRYNAIWMADQSHGSIKIYDSIFIGDYENQVGGINSSWMYNASANSSFECINCVFRQDYFTTSAPTVQPTEPTVFADLWISISLFGTFDDDLDDDENYITKVINDAITGVLDTYATTDDEVYQSIDVTMVSKNTDKLLFQLFIDNTSWSEDEMIDILSADDDDDEDNTSLQSAIETEDTSDLFASDISSIVIESGMMNADTTTTDSGDSHGPSTSDSNDDGSLEVILIIMGVAIGVLLIVVAVLGVCLWKNSKRNQFSGKTIKSMASTSADIQHITSVSPTSAVTLAAASTFPKTIEMNGAGGSGLPRRPAGSLGPALPNEPGGPGRESRDSNPVFLKDDPVKVNMPPRPKVMLPRKLPPHVERRDSESVDVDEGLWDSTGANGDYE